MPTTRVLPDVVAAAEEQAAVDQVTVMRHDGTALYRSELADGGPALLAEQARP
ncbi:hypothetical protein ACGF13_38560 [Kitasatospora sp. NPDC048286]|uniref:hypothetical protein n=1 Tax=Kitasatospora sp. NPDC048286 TaxID=3364047 RepID=UPI00371C46A1